MDLLTLRRAGFVLISRRQSSSGRPRERREKATEAIHCTTPHLSPSLTSTTVEPRPEKHPDSESAT